MDWKSKMFLGMKMIQEACQENENWNRCAECPFDACCTVLMDEKLIDPFSEKGVTFVNENGDALLG